MNRPNAQRRGVPLVVDLFAGAGGMSVGASQAGARVAASVELDAIACETLRFNQQFHGNVLQADVSSMKGDALREICKASRQSRLIIVGGPPCQPFSKAAYWTEEGEESAYRRARAKGVRTDRPAAPTKVRPDERRDLVHEFWRLVRESEADAFVFENVPSIKHPRNRPVLDKLIAAARRAGYGVVEATVNAAEYGVPQTRERVIVLGSKRGVPALPSPTHTLEKTKDMFLSQAITAGEALEGLDDPAFFEPEEVVKGRWAEHLREVPPGWNYKAHTAWAGHPKPTFETETRFWHFLLKLSPDRPSWTLAATPGPWTGPFHWDSRRLRVPELAALQGFPREYKVAGSRRECIRQIGNAVPVPLARVLVRSVIESLER